MFSRRELPPGYKFTEDSDISTEEVVGLWQDAEFIPRNLSDDNIRAWEEALGFSTFILGVRDRRQNLVGMGTIDSGESAGMLNDLAVHPDHRHQGIGRTLVRERVAVADSMDIARLKVCLTESNTLRPLYLELGFRALRPGGIVLTREK